jgi:hypothetical protein
MQAQNDKFPMSPVPPRVIPNQCAHCRGNPFFPSFHVLAKPVEFWYTYDTALLSLKIPAAEGGEPDA